jgi:hypothetical protein
MDRRQIEKGEALQMTQVAKKWLVYASAECKCLEVYTQATIEVFVFLCFNSSNSTQSSELIAL